MVLAVYILFGIGALGLMWLAWASDRNPAILKRAGAVIASILALFLIVATLRGDLLSRSPNPDDSDICGAFPVC